MTKEDLINYIDTGSPFRPLAIAFIIAILITSALVYADMKTEDRWRKLPCSTFENYKISQMPARCIKEYQK